MYNVQDQIIETLQDFVKRTDEINKRLIICIVAIVITFCVMITVICGFLYLGKPYQETSQVISQDEIRQEIRNGGN